MKGIHGTGSEPHPSFLGLGDRVSAVVLAERLRVTPAQAERFLRQTGFQGKTWRALQVHLGFGERFPACYRPVEVARMMAVSKRSVYRWATPGILCASRGLRFLRLRLTLFNKVRPTRCLQLAVNSYRNYPAMNALRNLSSAAAAAGVVKKGKALNVN